MIAERSAPPRPNAPRIVPMYQVVGFALAQIQVEVISFAP